MASATGPSASATGPSASETGPSATGPSASATGPSASATGPSATGPSATAYEYYAESDNESDDETLDTSWLDEFKQAEASYNNFYKEPVNSIRLYMLYINELKEIVLCVKNRYKLDAQNCLTRERILPLIQHYQQQNGQQYKLHSLLRYNIDLNPEEISDFVNEMVPLSSSSRFLTTEKYLDDISYKDSITMFHNLNALYFIFLEVPKKECNQSNTKRIKLVAHTAKTKRNNHKKNLKIAKEIG
jgi:hypothetical protein